MDKIKIGIIGTGMAWQRLHRPAFQRLSDKYEVVAVCDKNPEKAKQAGAELLLGADKIFGDVNKMLTEAAPEAVDILVPIQENYETARNVVNKGIHFIAEKPFAATEEGAKELIKLGKKNKVKIMVAENYRYEEENIIIKKALEDKVIGNAVYFIDNNVTEFTKEMLEDTFSSAEWRQHPEFQGGIFLDSGVHHIARMRFLFGNVKNIYAKGRSAKLDFCPYSCINAMLTFKENIIGHYSFFNIAKETQAPLVGLRIFGTAGEIYLEERGCGFVNLSFKDGTHQAISYTPFNGYYNELNNFYEAVRNDGDIVSTPDKELGDIQTIYDILKSAEANEVVEGSNRYKRRVRK